jgi:hypothetical protein
VLGASPALPSISRLIAMRSTVQDLRFYEPTAMRVVAERRL